MKRLFYLLFTIALILSLNLVIAAPAMANDIQSSTMHFHGELTDEGGGVYTGTILMTQGEYYVPGGPGEATYTGGGFDVYAKEGGTAYVQGMTPDSWIIGSDHDAYSESGPWGSWYDPDCADWEQYSLELTADHWYLRYTPTGESPMSGVMTWYGDGTGYAAETDLGTQDGGHDGSAAHGGGAQAWDWDCGWGVEVIPLELPGFYVEVSPTGSYDVTLTPSGGTITIAKETLPDGSTEEFEFTGAVPGVISDGETLYSGCIVPGQYSVTELVPDCWELTGIDSDDNNGSIDLPTATATINLDPGEDVVITYQDMQWGWITVEKQTDPEGADILFEFIGDRSGFIGDDEQLTGLCLEPYKTYWSQEMDMWLWELMDIMITGETHPAGTPSYYDLSERKVYFNLDPGEDIKATFTNKYFPPPEEPPAEDHGAPVGIEVFSVNKPALLAPWIALAAVITAGGVLLARRYRAHR